MARALYSSCERVAKGLSGCKPRQLTILRITNVSPCWGSNDAAMSLRRPSPGRHTRQKRRRSRLRFAPGVRPLSHYIPLAWNRSTERSAESRAPAADLGRRSPTSLFSPQYRSTVTTRSTDGLVDFFGPTGAAPHKRREGRLRGRRWRRGLDHRRTAFNTHVQHLQPAPQEKRARAALRSVRPHQNLDDPARPQHDRPQKGPV